MGFCPCDYPRTFIIYCVLYAIGFVGFAALVAGAICLPALQANVASPACQNLGAPGGAIVLIVLGSISFIIPLYGHIKWARWLTTDPQAYNEGNHGNLDLIIMYSLLAVQGIACLLAGLICLPALQTQVNVPVACQGIGTVNGAGALTAVGSVYFLLPLSILVYYMCCHIRRRRY